MPPTPKQPLKDRIKEQNKKTPAESGTRIENMNNKLAKSKVEVDSSSGLTPFHNTTKQLTNKQLTPSQPATGNSKGARLSPPHRLSPKPKQLNLEKSIVTNNSKHLTPALEKLLYNKDETKLRSKSISDGIGQGRPGSCKSDSSDDTYDYPASPRFDFSPKGKDDRVLPLQRYNSSPTSIDVSSPTNSAKKTGGGKNTCSFRTPPAKKLPVCPGAPIKKRPSGDGSQSGGLTLNNTSGKLSQLHSKVTKSSTNNSGLYGIKMNPLKLEFLKDSSFGGDEVDTFRT